MQSNSRNIFQRVISNAIQGRRKFTSLYQIYGIRSTLKQVRKNLLLLETTCRLDKDLSTSEVPIKSKIPLRIEVLSKGLNLNHWEGRKKILQIRGEYGLVQFSKRFERGDLSFAAYSNGKFTGFIWIEFPPVTEAGYSLLHDEAYTYDAWTFDKFRGNRVMPFIQQSIFNHLRRERKDIRNIVTHVATWNKASLSGDQRAGYIITRLELIIVIFGFHRKLISNKEVPRDLIMHQS